MPRKCARNVLGDNICVFPGRRSLTPGTVMRFLHGVLVARLLFGGLLRCARIVVFDCSKAGSFVFARCRRHMGMLSRNFEVIIARYFVSRFSLGVVGNFIYPRGDRPGVLSKFNIARSTTTAIFGIRFYFSRMASFTLCQGSETRSCN